MTRDEARAKWAETGLTYDVLTDDTIKMLRDRIDAALRSSDCIRDYRADSTPEIQYDAGWKWVAITCAAYYFTGRQCVTFESDGFIGFAGWASDENVQPILSAFCEWVDEVSHEALWLL